MSSEVKWFFLTKEDTAYKDMPTKVQRNESRYKIWAVLRVGFVLDYHQTNVGGLFFLPGISCFTPVLTGLTSGEGFVLTAYFP